MNLIRHIFVFGDNYNKIVYNSWNMSVRYRLIPH
uniref:Uncharacterized protein n=1 Tax=Anguilla anguilla TaxID=7936 RepID=A0A0E9SBQ8_ANGAN